MNRKPVYDLKFAECFEWKLWEKINTTVETVKQPSYPDIGFDFVGRVPTKYI